MPFTWEWAAVWAIFKRVWWAIPLVGVLWYGYDWSFQRGSHSRDKQVKTLTAERDGWKAKFEAQELTLLNQQQAHQAAVVTLKADQAGIVDGLTARLTAAENKAAKVKIVTTEVIRYVPKEVDAKYPVSNGFVRLLNDSNTESTPAAPAVPASGPTNDAAPSPIALSTIGAIVRDNYAECTARGEVIKAWQEWYPKVKAAWEKAVATQSDFKVVNP